jgi:hypothetical protein
VSLLNKKKKKDKEKRWRVSKLATSEMLLWCDTLHQDSRRRDSRARGTGAGVGNDEHNEQDDEPAD